MSFPTLLSRHWNTCRCRVCCASWTHKLAQTSNSSYSSPAKARAIAIPVDLDSQVNTLSLKVHSTMVQRAAKDWRSSARSRPHKQPLGGPDYKNIIEKLQVCTAVFLRSMLMSACQHAHNGTRWKIRRSLKSYYSSSWKGYKCPDHILSTTWWLERKSLGLTKVTRLLSSGDHECL